MANDCHLPEPAYVPSKPTAYHDPRVEPWEGDGLVLDGEERVVIAVSREAIDYATKAGYGQCTRDEWKAWAADAELVRLSVRACLTGEALAEYLMHLSYGDPSDDALDRVMRISLRSNVQVIT